MIIITILIIKFKYSTLNVALTAYPRGYTVDKRYPLLISGQ